MINFVVKYCQMFRHKGKKRTYRHNLRLASLLSLVAGTVNITGVLSVNVLTTNVTGHFAYFGEQFSSGNYNQAVNFLLFILSFLAGSFVSNFLIETISRNRSRHIYLIPILIEAILLSFAATIGINHFMFFSKEMIALILLFSMGLQNALVTKASQSVVRTTHLTGLFTDLGIESSQFFFYRKIRDVQPLIKSIKLKIAIIICFFGGCVAGGFLFSKMRFYTLFFSVALLVIALLYDTILLHFYHLKRRLPKPLLTKNK